MGQRPIARMMQRGKARCQKTTKVIESRGRIKVCSGGCFDISRCREFKDKDKVANAMHISSL
jgi:hypothetical protein